MTNPPGAMPPLPEPLDHLYEFGSPFGGVHRTADSSTWNGSRPKRSVAVYTAEQMQTYAAPLIARVAELEADLARTERNRGMWKQQCFVQAVDLAEMRKNSTRYLWLRERNAVLNDDSIFTAKRVQNEDGSFSHNDLIANEEMDAAIDAAIAALHRVHGPAPRHPHSHPARRLHCRHGA